MQLSLKSRDLNGVKILNRDFLIRINLKDMDQNCYLAIKQPLTLMCLVFHGGGYELITSHKL